MKEVATQNLTEPIKMLKSAKSGEYG